MSHAADAARSGRTPNPGGGPFRRAQGHKPLRAVSGWSGFADAEPVAGALPRGECCAG